MSRRNGAEQKRERRMVRQFRDDARTAALKAEQERWEKLRPGPTARSVMAGFLRSYAERASLVPLDSLFTFVATSPDVDGLEEKVREAVSSGSSGFLQYARIRCAAQDGGTTDFLFVMTMSVCGPGNYRILFGECGACSFHPVFDFLNSTFEFDRSCCDREVWIVPEGEVVSSSSPAADEGYLDEFKEKAGISGREFLAVSPYEMLFRKADDGSYVPVVSVKEYNEEVMKINSLMPDFR